MTARFRPVYGLPYFGSKLPAVGAIVQAAREVGTTLFVEPFLGSGVASLNAAHHLGVDWIGYDVDPRVIALHDWLSTASEAEVVAVLDEHDERLGPVERSTKGKDSHVGYDVRHAGYAPGAEALLRLTGAPLLGTLHIHKMRRKPTRRWLPSLPAWRRGTAIHGSFERSASFDVPGAFFLLDPPYLGTDSDYTKGHAAVATFSAARFMAWLGRLRSPRLITYGADAREVLPDLDWRPLYTRSSKPTLNGQRDASAEDEAREELYAFLPGTW